jgi:hypothetical protein
MRCITKPPPTTTFYNLLLSLHIAFALENVVMFVVIVIIVASSILCIRVYRMKLDV